MVILKKIKIYDQLGNSILLCDEGDDFCVPSKMKTEHKICAYMWIVSHGCDRYEVYASKVYSDMSRLRLLNMHKRSIHYSMKNLMKKKYIAISRIDTDQDSYRNRIGKRTFYSLTHEGFMIGEAIFNVHSDFFSERMCLSRKSHLLA